MPGTTGGPTVRETGGAGREAKEGGETLGDWGERSSPDPHYSLPLRESYKGESQMGSFSLIFSPPPILAPETRMSGLVPPPHTRPGSCTLPWRWEAVEGTADFGGVGMGWGVGGGKTKCVAGRRVLRAVGEPASNRGQSNPFPKRGHGIEAPSPSRYPSELPLLYPCGDPGLLLPFDSTSHLRTWGWQPLPLR